MTHQITGVSHRYSFCGNIAWYAMDTPLSFFCQFLGVVSEAVGTLGVIAKPRLGYCEGDQDGHHRWGATAQQLLHFDRCFQCFHHQFHPFPVASLNWAQPCPLLRSINSHSFMQVLSVFPTHLFSFLMCCLQVALWEGLELHDVVTSRIRSLQSHHGPDT